MSRPDVQLDSSTDAHQSRILNLGCGNRYLNQAVNVDRSIETHPDVIHDLNQFPWPFPSNHFTEVLAYDVIEHLDDFIASVNEIYRICRDGAVIRITVPHFSCANAFSDPTHRSFFGYFSMDYVTGENELQFYTRARFQRLSTRLLFQPSLMNKVVWRLANRYPATYESRWAWIFPAWYLSFQLKVLKPRV